MNIIDLIRTTFASGETTNAISSLIGLSPEQTERATSAAIPSLLAGLSHAASTPEGAERLARTAAQQDPGMLDNLSGTLSSQGGDLAHQGQGMLNSLLGSGSASLLSGILAKFTGANEGATGKLLGVCAPLILGVLGKQQRSMNLGPGGLASMLSGQKDQIRAAMPPALGAMLSKVPGFGQVLGSQPATASAADYTSRQRAQMTERSSAYAGDAEPARPSAMKWAIPLVLGVGILGGLTFWSRTRPEDGMGRPGVSQETVIGGDTSVISDSARLLTHATALLSGIKDKSSAEAAMPKLESINKSLLGLRSASSQIPESFKATAKETLKPALEKLQEAAAPVLAMTGVGEVIRPHVEQITASVNSLGL